MRRKLPADLTPTPASPGLRVRSGTKYTSSQGDYLCRCGDEDHANGDANVKALVDRYTDHKKTCEGR
ncbi:hypothetical protein [Streptomyces sp. SID3212]|uniref:hypothetical protein n=1 Tax=Streptomyces sp. SID3212 TaxID=2690259 RepID=UPI00136F39C2|nr:hypothetical protein [Streptomyces sp. SID3212]MYV51037.1 hypothetical protein [Streptomyces sp. SID3212]